MPRSGGPRRPLLGAAMLGLAAWQAAFINTQAGGRSRGLWKPIAPKAKIVAAATTGSENYLWVQVKGGGPIMVPTERIQNVFMLLKAVYIEEETRLKPSGVTASLLRLYASEEAYNKNATALRGDEKIANLPSSVTYDNPLHVAYDEPKIGGAGVSEASFSEAPLRKGGTGSGSFLWVQVKGGEPVEYPTEDLRNVGGLLKAVYIEVQRRLPAGVGVDQLKLYASEEAYKKNEANTALASGLLKAEQDLRRLLKLSRGQRSPPSPQSSTSPPKEEKAAVGGAGGGRNATPPCGKLLTCDAT